MSYEALYKSENKYINEARYNNALFLCIKTFIHAATAEEAAKATAAEAKAEAPAAEEATAAAAKAEAKEAKATAKAID